MTYARFFGAMVALCLTHAALAGECKLQRIAELPFQVKGRHLVVQGQINGNDATMIFDTGAQTTVLTENAVGHLNLRALRGEARGLGSLGVAYGVGGGVGARAVEATSVDFGGLKAHNFAFLSIDKMFILGGQPMDGLLSADVLAKYDIDLDFISRRIRLFYPQGDCSHPAAYLHGNLFQVPMLKLSADLSPRIQVQVNGATLTALLDTGADGTLLSREAAARLNLKPDASRKVAMISGVGSRSEKAELVTLPSLGIGDLELQNWHAGISDLHLSSPDSHVDIILGLDLLTRLHPWLSYSSGTFIFQYPPAPSPSE